MVACATAPKKKTIDPLDAHLNALRRQEQDINRQLQNRYMPPGRRKLLLDERASIRREEKMILTEQGKTPPPRTKPRAPAGVPQWDPHPY